MVRPFRFSITAPPLQPSLPAPDRVWVDEVRRIEDVGITTLVAVDHFTGGHGTEPMVALTAAAIVTSTLRLRTGVLGNDYRHPVLTHRMAATLDVLSGGRFDLGIGAGWMTSDYEAAGIPRDRPGIRVSRLEEAIAVIKGLFGPEPFSFEGEHYRITALDGTPKPVSRPRPPLLVGGGSPRVLRIAGREADIVNVSANLEPGVLGAHAVVDFAADRVAEKLTWVAEGAARSGRTLDEIELGIDHWLVKVTGSDAEATAFCERMAAQFGITGPDLAASPAVLVGTTGAIAEKLRADRDRFGFSAVHLDAGTPLGNLDDLLPVVAALAGT